MPKASQAWPGNTSPAERRHVWTSRRLYSAVIDVSQTSVTPSGRTQSAPMLGPGSLFMSPPFIWQSKVYEPPGPSHRSWAGDKGRRCTHRPPGGPAPPGGVMLMQHQPRPLLHIDGRWAAASLAGTASEDGDSPLLTHPEKGWPWAVRSELVGPPEPGLC